MSRLPASRVLDAAKGLRSGQICHADKFESVDVLLKSILSLPPDLLDDLCNRLACRPQLTKAGWRLSERRVSTYPNEARDAKWTKLSDNGLSYGDIARACGAPRSTVASACNRYRRRCMQ